MPLRPLVTLFRRPTRMSHRDLRVYIDLIDHLYSDIGSVAGGVVGIMTLAFVGYSIDQENYFEVIMALVALVGLGRLAKIVWYRRHLRGRIRTYAAARRWELAYGVGAVAFAFIVGALGVLVIGDPKATSIAALVTASVAGYAGGIAGRNAARPFVAICQVLATCLPLACYCVYLGGGPNYGIAIMLAIYSLTLIKIVMGLRRITNKAFETQRDVGEVNARLDSAITHMKSGLCMMDSSGAIQILNERARELLRLPDAEYRRIHEVIVGALSAGALHHSDAEAIQSAIAERREITVSTSGPQSAVLSLKAAMTPTGGTVVTLDDITAQTRAKADVERLAKYDALTGLANRATAMTALAAALAESGADQERCGALLLIDLDKFKEVNDTLGHDVGDELLMKVAERLKAAAPPHGTVGRLGGDEFVIVAPALNRRESLALAHKVNRAIAKPMRLMGQLCTTTASIGVSLAGEHGEEPAELVKAADIALYARKGAGRNGHDLFDAEMARSLARRRKLEQDLAAALQVDGLDVAFQPIVDAADHAVIGCEALARWTHPDFGAIGPDEFIPIAESTGLVAELGRCVLRRACAEAAAWPAHVKVSVNVSAIQLRNREQLFDDIWSALTGSGLPANRLDLEMTESVLIEDAEGVRSLIEALRRMDVSISLDDFGTGYSSLAYVQNYRFDKIKLDKAFARGIEHDNTTRATVAALASIAAATGSRLLLEGVETEAQATIAREQGVHQLQGYHFGRPMSAEQILGKIGGELREKRVA
jgi:diguanylate cyclase (GGDEF)-like protein